MQEFNSLFYFCESKTCESIDMKGKLALTASPLIVWFRGSSILINVLANSFESLQPYPFYDIIADPVKRTKQNKLSSLQNESQVGPCETTTSFQWVEENTSFIRAHRHRGSRQHSIVSERNFSMAKKPAEMGSLRHKALTSLAQKRAMGTFCQQVSTQIWDSELLWWKLKTRQDRNDFYRFQGCFPTSWALSCTENLT